MSTLGRRTELSAVGNGQDRQVSPTSGKSSLSVQSRNNPQMVDHLAPPHVFPANSTVSHVKSEVLQQKSYTSKRGITNHKSAKSVNASARNTMQLGVNAAASAAQESEAVPKATGEGAHHGDHHHDCHDEKEGRKSDFTLFMENMIKSYAFMKRQMHELQETIANENGYLRTVRGQIESLKKDEERLVGSINKKQVALDEYRRTMDKGELGRRKIMESSQSLLHVINRETNTIQKTRGVDIVDTSAVRAYCDQADERLHVFEELVGMRNAVDRESSDEGGERAEKARADSQAAQENEGDEGGSERGSAELQSATAEDPGDHVPVEEGAEDQRSADEAAGDGDSDSEDESCAADRESAQEQEEQETILDDTEAGAGLE